MLITIVLVSRLRKLLVRVRYKLDTTVWGGSIWNKLSEKKARESEWGEDIERVSIVLRFLRLGSDDCPLASLPGLFRLEPRKCYEKREIQPAPKRLLNPPQKRPPPTPLSTIATTSVVVSAASAPVSPVKPEETVRHHLPKNSNFARSSGLQKIC